jgi:uncharacterized protein
MKYFSTTAAVLLALTLTTGARAQDGPPALDLKAVALTAQLFTAIRQGDAGAVTAALDAGADPNRPNWLELLPTDWTQLMQRPELTALLIRRGAKPELGRYGSSVVGAAMMGLDDEAVSLLARGVGSTSKRPDKATTLMLAAASGASKTLVALKPDAEELARQDIDGATALIYAARRGQVATAKQLLALGADPNQADSHGRTPLMYAAMNGSKEVVELLLARGARPNLADKEGATALHLTARYCGESGIAQKLLKAKASVMGQDATGKTPLALAQARRFTGLAQTLRTAGARPELVSAAVAAPNAAVKKSLAAMQGGMKRFLAQSECSSCHHQGLGLAVLGYARLKGFAVEKPLIDENAARITGDLKRMAPLVGLSQSDTKLAAVIPTSEMDELAIGSAYFLLGLEGAQVPSDPGLQQFAQFVASLQKPEGNWSFTLHRGPLQASFHTTTAFIVRGLKRYLPEQQGAPVLTKARAWLQSARVASTEDRASRLMGLRWAGVEPRALRQDVEGLKALQNPDGGWGASPGAPSNPLATGQALYSLRVAGVAPTDSGLKQAIGYLIRMQDESGAWYLNKTVPPFNDFFDTGFPGGESQYSSFGATSWATLALLEVGEGGPR